MELLELIEKYKKQEQELQFDSFSNEDAWVLGNMFVERAKRDKLPIAIDITLAGNQLFRYSFEGATPYNELWIKRKQTTVMMQRMSSIRFGANLRSEGRRIGIECLLDPFEHAVCGGGFPLKLKNTGVVGCIAVSGLPDVDDHQLIVDVITEFLAQK